MYSPYTDACLLTAHFVYKLGHVQPHQAWQEVSWMPYMPHALAVQLSALLPASLPLLQHWWSPLSRQLWVPINGFCWLPSLFCTPQIQLREPLEGAWPAQFSMSPAHCYISGHRGSDWVDLEMQRLLNFLSSEQLMNIREEIRDHWSTLPSERTSFTPFHCSCSLWSQSRSSETFLSSWCVLQSWGNLRVNQCPTTTSQNCRWEIWAAGSFLSTQLTY